MYFAQSNRDLRGWVGEMSLVQATLKAFQKNSNRIQIFSTSLGCWVA